MNVCVIPPKNNREATTYEEKSKEAFDQIVVIKNNIKQIEKNILNYQSEILDFHKKVYEGSEDVIPPKNNTDYK